MASPKLLNRKPEIPIDRDAVVEVLESTLRDQLAEMPTDMLWDTARKLGVADAANGEPRRRMDIIEDILTAEIEKARREMQSKVRSTRTDRAPVPSPADPDITQGRIRMGLEEMALAFAPFLPANAQVHPMMSRAEMFDRTAQKIGEDTVAFSRRDSQGNERLYRIKMKLVWTVEVIEGV